MRIERAVLTDRDEILKVMEEAASGLSEQDWYVTDDREYVEAHLGERGFILKAVFRERIQGFLSVHVPGQEEGHLGEYLGLNEEEKNLCAYMDSVAVREEARGQGLMRTLLAEAEKLLRAEGYVFLLGTVHPKNRFSHENFRRQGYRDLVSVEKYGGLPRVVVFKEIKTENHGK